MNVLATLALAKNDMYSLALAKGLPMDIASSMSSMGDKIVKLLIVVLGIIVSIVVIVNIIAAVKNLITVKKGGGSGNMMESVGKPIGYAVLAVLLGVLGAVGLVKVGEVIGGDVKSGIGSDDSGVKFKTK